MAIEVRPTTIVGAYWDARRESLDACVERSVEFFAALAEIDRAYRFWYQKGRSRKDALTKPVTATPDELRALLFRGRHRGDDSERTVFEDLGYRFELWNGADDAVSVSVSIHCGAWSKWVGNAVAVDVPGSRSQGATRFSLARAKRMVLASVSTWEPSWATWIRSDFREAQGWNGRKRGEIQVALGWMTYLDADRASRLEDLSEIFQVEPVGDGLLLVLAPTPDEVLRLPLKEICQRNAGALL